MTYRDVSPSAAFAARSSARLIDVREPDEFRGELGRIPGSELVPLSKITAAAATWDQTEPIIVVCRTGGRSSRAAHALATAGFCSVMNLAGGMLAYNAAGLPVERG